jgi:hypothetical protein
MLTILRELRRIQSCLYFAEFSFAQNKSAIRIVQFIGLYITTGREFEINSISRFVYIHYNILFFNLKRIQRISIAVKPELQCL